MALCVITKKLEADWLFLISVSGNTHMFILINSFRIDLKKWSV